MNHEREKRIRARMEELRACREEAEITREANRRLDAEKERKEAGQKAIDSLICRARSGDTSARVCANLIGLEY
jgi:hypothetical protein